MLHVQFVEAAERDGGSPVPSSYSNGNGNGNGHAKDGQASGRDQMTLSFQSLSYTLRLGIGGGKHTQKVVFTNANAKVSSGQLLCVLGSSGIAALSFASLDFVLTLGSGSGKTSLLDVLSYRHDSSIGVCTPCLDTMLSPVLCHSLNRD